MCANTVHRNGLSLVTSGTAGIHSISIQREGEWERKTRERARDRARSCAASERIACGETLKPVYGQPIHLAYDRPLPTVDDIPLTPCLHDNVGMRLEM